MAPTAASLQAVFSTLFRLVAYIFLRIIPTRWSRYFGPTFFLGYIITCAIDILTTPPKEETPVKLLVAKEEKVEVAPANGDDSTLDVTVTDTIAVATIPTRPDVRLSTILFSLPTPAKWAKFLSLAINLALVSMMVDFVVRPTFDNHADLVFTRVGAVTSDSAKIVVRYPGVEDGVRIVWKQVDATATIPSSDEVGWIDGPIVELNPHQDWVGHAKLMNLWTGTKYEYRLAAANSSLLPYPSTPITFKTFPDSRIPGTKFKFIASSCILPNFPYKPFTPTTRIKGFELLHHYLSTPPPASESPVPSKEVSAEHEEFESKIETPITPREADSPAEPTVVPEVAPAVPEATISTVSVGAPTSDAASAKQTSPVDTEFLILLGDFIYADIPRKTADDRDEFLTAYRRTYASEDFRKVYERLPIVNIYDDHEIVNDFNGYSNESAPLWTNASAAWSTYQGNANYDSYAVDSKGHKPHYYEFTYGDVAFFVLDTRRYRSVVGINETEGDIPTLLGEKQMADFTQWVSKVNSTAAFKFIVSSVPLTGMWGWPNGQIDTWMGAPAERRAFLDLLEYVPNVVVISGDRHEFAAVEHLGANSIAEFSISPLSQFYVPYAKTFWESNAPRRKVWGKANITTEDGTIEEQDVVAAELPTEKELKYIPHGNYKWGTFEVDTTDADHPTVKFDLSIDGKDAWQYTIVGKPVRWTGSTSISPSALVDGVAESVKNVLSKLGRIFG